MNKVFCGVLCILSFATLITSGFSSVAGISPERIIQVARLDGGQHNNLFGYSLALEGNILVVGDPYDDQAGVEAGAVTIFQSDQADGWKEITRVTPVDAEAGIHFGRDVAISGDLLAVGAPYDNDLWERSGSVYLFERNQGGADAWGQVAKLVASDAYTYDQFGWAVAVSGDIVAAGAYTKMYGGRVYIYEHDSEEPGEWVEVAQLNPDPPGLQDCFGEALDMEDDLLAVGAYGGGDYSGSAYIFQRQPVSNEWQRMARFRAADTDGYHYFGYSIALHDWNLLAGAPGADGMAGAAYIFTSNPSQPEIWIEQARLSASDATLGDYFGFGLDLSNDFAWIGSPLHTDASGAIYLYERDQGGQNQWGEVIVMTGDDTIPGDEFGYAATLDDNIGVVGAPRDLSHGAAYIFNINPPWQINFPVMMHTSSNK